jgi:Asp-tRNA(Asn)/Glu-tRNA(Gln) amidotransferase A subunit family amidase
MLRRIGPRRETAALIRDKKLSPVEYTTALLARIERHDPKLNAFIAVMPERALAAARFALDVTRNARRWRFTRGAYYWIVRSLP